MKMIHTEESLLKQGGIEDPTKPVPFDGQTWAVITSSLGNCREAIEVLEAKVEEMDKYLNILGAENTDLKERVEKLEQLTNPEQGT